MKTHRILAISLSVLLLLTGTSTARATSYTYDALNRLTKVAYTTGASIEYSYDAAGNITQISATEGDTSSSLALTAGWNLTSSTVVVPASILDDQNNFISVWKWSNNNWSVYLPGETPHGSYAQSKGFSSLSTINPGEGFWVNSKLAASVPLTGTPEYGPLSFGSGWSLLGLKSDTAINVTEIVVNQPEIISIWKWENDTWSVSLPNETTPGDYANSKGFGQLETISPGEGFWVNNK